MWTIQIEAQVHKAHLISLSFFVIYRFGYFSSGMGKSLSRLSMARQSQTEGLNGYLLERFKSFVSKFGLSNRAKELSLLNTKVEELSWKLSKRDQDFEQLFNKFKEVADREGQYISEIKMLQEQSNNKLLQQIIEKERLEHNFQLNMYESQNKVIAEMEKLTDHISKPKVASKVGEIGEDFVLECLQRAFPNNTSIIRSGQNNSGDILFRIDNTEKFIMFEIKNTLRNVSGINNGKDLTKFFSDMDNPSTIYNISGGVLVSLNSPVDINVPPLVPRFMSGKPYLYIDNMNQQYPDPECLLKVVVHMMTYLIKNSEHVGMDSFGLKIENYLRSMKGLMLAYQRLYKNQEVQRKNLDQMKSSLESLNTLFLEDLKEAKNLEEEKLLSLGKKGACD